MAALNVSKSVVVFSKIPQLKEAVLSKAAPFLESINVREFDPVKDDLTVLTSANIVLADPNLITPQIANLANTEWLSMTWAGVEGIVSSIREMNSPPPWKFTRFAGYFGPAMAEYVIGTVIMRERGFIDYATQQATKTWMQKPRYRGLPELSIGLLGMGEIGKVVAERCSMMGMTVKGLVRNLPASHNRIKNIAYYTQNQIEDLLGSCDYICNILPSTPNTIGLLNGRFDQFKAGACFINVGRGSIVEEEQLVAALTSGKLSGAILDVFDKEPLPSTSKLWTTPGVIITPHVSAISFSGQIADGFAKNLDLFLAGKPLKHTVDFNAGY